MARTRGYGARLLTGLVSVAVLGYLVSLGPGFAGVISTGGPLALLLSVVLVCVFGACVGACILALVLAMRSWSREGVPSVALFLCAAAASWAVILGVNRFRVDDGFIHASSSGGVIDVVFLVGGLVLAAATFLRFSALFPRPLGPEDLYEGAAPKSVYFRLRRWFLRPTPVWLTSLSWPFVVVGTGVAGVLVAESFSPDGSVSVDGALGVPFLLLWSSFPLLALVFGMQNLMAGFRRADASERRQLLWMVVGVVTSAWMILLPLLALPALMILGVEGHMGWWSNVPVLLWGAAPGVLVVSIAVAMFYTGAIDPGLVLRRSTVLGVLGAIWVGLFAIVEGFFADWAASSMGLPESVVSAAVALAAAGVALAFRGRLSTMTRGLGKSGQVVDQT